MPRLVIAQPLPQDLRNGSFRGMNCEGWDFEGRDVRGCDFRNAKLKGANFSKVVAGRSRKQIIINLLIAVAVAVAGAVASAAAGAVAVVVAATGASAAAGASAFASTVAGAGACAVAGAVAGTVAGGVLRAIDAFSKGRMPEGILFSAIAIIYLLFFLYSLREAIREFKNATGTNFKGADLRSVDFSHATLSNCNFDQTDTSYIN